MKERDYTLVDYTSLGVTIKVQAWKVPYLDKRANVIKQVKQLQEQGAVVQEIQKLMAKIIRINKKLGIYG